MKEIEIGKQKFKITCHASVYSRYNDFFNKNIIKDLNFVGKFIATQYSLSKKYTKEELKSRKIDSKTLKDLSGDTINEISLIIEEKIFNDTVDLLDEFVENITKIAWICIYDNKTDIEEYKKWYSSLETLKMDDKWIMEVVEVATNCFR